MFGLPVETIEAMQAVFEKYPSVEKVWLYGSRSKGNFKEGSDIDLVVEGTTLNLSGLQKIETELDELLLPYKIDLSLLHHIHNSDLLSHITRVGKVFFERKK